MKVVWSILSVYSRALAIMQLKTLVILGIPKIWDIIVQQHYKALIRLTIIITRWLLLVAVLELQIQIGQILNTQQQSVFLKMRNDIVF